MKITSIRVQVKRNSTPVNPKSNKQKGKEPAEPTVGAGQDNNPITALLKARKLAEQRVIEESIQSINRKGKERAEPIVGQEFDQTGKEHAELPN